MRTEEKLQHIKIEESHELLNSSNYRTVYVVLIFGLSVFHLIPFQLCNGQWQHSYHELREMCPYLRNTAASVEMVEHCGHQMDTWQL